MRRKYLMTPISITEYLLIFSAVPATLVGLAIVEVSFLREWSQNLLAGVLDLLCAINVPSLWCRAPRSISAVATIQAFNYFVFLAVSAYFVRWIWSPSYSRPSNYTPGAAPLWHQIIWGGWWLFALLGGQLLPQRSSYWSYMGLFFAVCCLSAGLFGLRLLMVSLRFTSKRAQG